MHLDTHASRGTLEHVDVEHVPDGWPCFSAQNETIAARLDFLGEGNDRFTTFAQKLSSAHVGANLVLDDVRVHHFVEPLFPHDLAFFLEADGIAGALAFVGVEAVAALVAEPLSVFLHDVRAL